MPSFARRPCTRRCPGTPVYTTLLEHLHISPSSPLCSLEREHPGRPWVENKNHFIEIHRDCFVERSQIWSCNAKQISYLSWHIFTDICWDSFRHLVAYLFWHSFAFSIWNLQTKLFVRTDVCRV